MVNPTPPIRRLREVEVRSIIAEEMLRAGWETISALMIRDGRRPETEKLAWWRTRTPAGERSDTQRSLAYLRAYLRIAGGDVLHAGGLFLERRRLWMDRSVIGRLERDGYIAFEDDAREPRFRLTPAGATFVEG